MKEILTTMEYGIFQKLEGNREVNLKRKQKIIKSINEVGYITSPILVNENYEIIDGQGRFEALKELGMPIEYIIQPGIGIKECVSMNINQTNWTAYDYINTYAEKGYDSYVYLQNLQKRFPLIISLEIFTTAIFGKTRFEYDLFSSGSLSISEDMYLEAQDKLSKIYPLVLNYGKPNRMSNLLKGILHCFNIKGIDMDRLIDKVGEELATNRVPATANISQTMQYLEDIYNQNKRGGREYIYTEYRKNAENRLKRKKD